MRPTLFGDVYHFATIRSTVAAFGRLFSNMTLQRKNNQKIKVPIAYGPRRAWYVKITADQGNTKYEGHSVATTLPRFSFQMTGMNYDPARAKSPTNIYRAKDPDLNRLIRQFGPVPYDFTMELSLMTKNTDDGLRIVEQILPQFKPQVSITVNDMPELGLTRDVPVIFTDVAQEDNAELAFTDRQVLSWTFNFILKSYLYPPITDGSVIKLVNVYINSRPDMTERIETIRAEVDPLTAEEWDVDSNGNPAYSIKETQIIEDGV